MTTLLISPPPKNTEENLYRFNNDVWEALQGMQYLKNSPVVDNADFSALGVNGTSSITHADGDDTEVSSSWNVYGAANAQYSMTTTPYPLNSKIKSNSDYFLNCVVTSATNNPFYLYQRITSKVRKLQRDYFTFTLHAKNKQAKAIGLRFDIFNFYDPSNSLVKGAVFWLQPGMNKISSTLLTPSLESKSVASGNYTEFRLNFVNLINGTADIELYQIKCELGKLSTPL